MAEFTYTSDETGTLTSDTEKGLKKLIRDFKKAEAEKEAKRSADYATAVKRCNAAVVRIYDNKLIGARCDLVLKEIGDRVWGATVGRESDTEDFVTITLRDGDERATRNIWTHGRKFLGILALFGDFVGYLIEDSDGEDLAHVLCSSGDQLSQHRLRGFTRDDFETETQRKERIEADTVRKTEEADAETAAMAEILSIE